MADDLRIYQLTDEQVAYDKDIELAADLSSFSNTKKMKVGTIYPKIDDLQSAGDFNPNSSTLRLGNGSGAEDKVTVTNMLNDSDVKEVIKQGQGIGIKLKLSASVSANGTGTKINGNLAFASNRLSTGKYLITHNLGNTNYMVVANVVAAENVTNTVKVCGIHQTNTNFTIYLADDPSVNDSDFRFSLFEYTL